MIEINSALIGLVVGTTVGLFMGKIEQLIFKLISTEKQKFERLEAAYKSAQKAYSDTLMAKVYDIKGAK